jgi:hypothetical protein
MDKTTVLEIIKMIETQIFSIVAPNRAYHIKDERISALFELKEHLQSFIEPEEDDPCQDEGWLGWEEVK